MWVNFSVFGSKRVSPPVDHTEPSGCTRMVCFLQSSAYSVTFSVFGSQRPSFFEPASASQTEPSAVGTAEWISAGPRFGTGNSFISLVVGLNRLTLFDCPYCGVQKF